MLVGLFYVIVSFLSSYVCYENVSSQSFLTETFHYFKQIVFIHTWKPNRDSTLQTGSECKGNKWFHTPQSSGTGAWPPDAI